MLDLRFYLLEESSDFIRISACQFVLCNEPCDGIQINAGDLKAEARAFHQRCAATHERVQNLEVPKVLRLLVVGVIDIPDCLGRFGLVGNGDSVLIENWLPVGILACWGCHCRRNEHCTEYTASPPCPPLAHLVNRLARIAFQCRQRVDREKRKIDFQAGLWPLRV